VQKFSRWNSISEMSVFSDSPLSNSSPNMSSPKIMDLKATKNSSTPSAANDLSSSGCSDKNGEGDTFSSRGDLKGQEELQENLKEYKKKSEDDYAKMKEQLQKSTFALRKLISYADKIYGWGFDAHSMNDCKKM